jgi:hypothetical protein
MKKLLKMSLLGFAMVVALNGCSGCKDGKKAPAGIDTNKTDSTKTDVTTMRGDTTKADTTVVKK